MRRIRIAQIGTSGNSHGNWVFNSLKKQSDVFEIAGYALPENEREKFPQRMADFAGYPELTVEEILNDTEIEAVTVETEELYLTKYALAAARAGKHIHMEKPGGIALADFEGLIETVRKQGTVFHTGYMYRYNPFVLDLKERVKKGELGEIISVEAQMNCLHYNGLRSWLSSFPGGMMFFLGCHLVDLILQFRGVPDQVVPLSKSTGVNGIPSKDFGMAVLEYPNGVSFAKVSAVEVGGYPRRQLVVSGTKGTVEIKPLEMPVGAEGGDQVSAKTEYFSENWFDRGVASASAPNDRYDAMMRAFAEMAAGERENPFGYDYELMLYQTLLKCCGVGQE